MYIKKHNLVVRAYLFLALRALTHDISVSSSRSPMGSEKVRSIKHSLLLNCFVGKKIGEKGFIILVSTKETICDAKHWLLGQNVVKNQFISKHSPDISLPPF